MKAISPIKRFWIILKLIYLYILYWAVGMMEESFYITKANYFVDLNWFHRAISNYEKALRDSKDHRIYSMLGYCYSRIGSHSEAVDHYRKAYNKIHDPHVDLGLAIAEYESGNIDKSEEIILELQNSNYDLDPSVQDTMSRLEAEIAIIRRERKNL